MSKIDYFNTKSFKEYSSYNYLLLGLGVGNKGIEKFFINNNIKYSVYDDMSDKNILNKKTYLEEVENELIFYDIIVKSSGIAYDHKLVQSAMEYGIEVVTDLDLYARFFPESFNITVTGSNGKTTTVNLIHSVLNGFKLVGNIGNPIFNNLSFTKNNKFIIEASSFMLEFCEYFNSKFNVLLNIIPTHLEHHHDFNSYIRSKMNLLKNTKKDDYIIYNYDDIVLRNLVKINNGIKIPISIKNLTLMNKGIGVYIKGDYIYYYNKKFMKLSKIKVLGEHNIYNIMACIAVCVNYYKLNNKKIFKNRIIKKICSFKGLEHRLEYIGKYGKTRFYNDSKSTNFNALRVALEAMKDKKVLLICGGKIRKDNYELIKSKIKNVRKVYCYGENRNEFYKFFIGEKKETYCFETLNEIINNLNIVNMDIVLFSPGSISYDQYIDYERRGTDFKRLIRGKYLNKRV